MGKPQFNMKLIHILKDILFRLRQDDSPKAVIDDFERHFKHICAIDMLLIVQELKSHDDEIISEDVKRLFHTYEHLHGHSIDSHVPKSYPQGHPLQIFKEENKACQTILDQLTYLMDKFEKHPQENILEKLRNDMAQLGQFYKHYHRKEKLFFPILERYRYYTLGRNMWAEDDRIRNLYKGTKSMLQRLPDLEFSYVKKSYRQFEHKFKEMIFDEEAILLPIVQSVFSDDDWVAIAEESEAFGYSFIEPEESWASHGVLDDDKKTEGPADEELKHFKFGGGFLTVKEANSILNNLPLEITFVDKNGIFKYFNEITKSSEMMFVRTPTSIGRSVANCHPPKSLRKVTQLIHDLKTKKKPSETMWFRKKDQYIHVTYKGIFDEDGEFLGILEYVQDMQPFFDLPREVKKEIT